ncbi:ABC transporter ATP-binding protein [Novosphingobium sp.]|uniref:ABC transporter ATP-binding protein n=1 Tax=Novosphingobium sp. TaxID=1874826 RepID=UPI0026284308|nr:ABC transporter ATP-binding protein [Novosphingobium sp.]
MKAKRPAARGGLWTSLRRLLRCVAPHLRAQWLTVAGAGLALIGATALRLLEPWPLKIVIDHVLTGQDALPMLPRGVDALALCAVLVLGIITLRAGCDFLATIGFAKTGARILGQLRYDLYRHLQTLSLAFHQRARTGDLTMRVVSDVASMREAMVTALMPFAANVLILCGMAGVMLVLDWQLALIAMAPLPLMALATARLGTRIQSVSRDQRKREGSVASTVTEALGGIRLIQALSLEDRMSSLFAAFNAGSQKGGVKAKRLAASLERTTDVLSGISTAAVLYFGARAVIDGRLSAGELVVFLTYLKNTFRPIRDFAKNSSRIAKAAAAGERIVDILDETPDIADKPGAIMAQPLQDAITFDTVSFGYDESQPVLDCASFRLQKGEFVALVGPSGVGKSSVLSLLLRLFEPHAGRITFDGHDLRDLQIASLRRQMSVVLQDNLFLADTVRENILLGCPGATHAEVEAAARGAFAHAFIMDLPQGYDTVLAERGASLSTGQRQRLSLARAALRKAPVLLLDEPTLGLDLANEALVSDAIAHLARSATVLMVTHDMKLAWRADRIVMIQQCRIIDTQPREVCHALVS